MEDEPSFFLVLVKSSDSDPSSSATVSLSRGRLEPVLSLDVVFGLDEAFAVGLTASLSLGLALGLGVVFVVALAASLVLVSFAWRLLEAVDADLLVSLTFWDEGLAPSLSFEVLRDEDDGFSFRSGAFWDEDDDLLLSSEAFWDEDDDLDLFEDDVEAPTPLLDVDGRST
jgi:hypothetical protein